MTMFNKFLNIILAITLLSVSAYKDVDDKYDYNSIFKNLTALHTYIECFLDKGPCTDLGSHIKNHLADQMKNSCANCDQVQEHYAHVFFDALKKKFPEEYVDYKKKYDKDGKHLAVLEKTVSVY